MSEAQPSAAAGQPVAAGNLRGILAMMTAMACFVINDAFVKLLGAELPSGEIIFLRGLAATAMLLLAAWHFGALGLPAGMLRPAFGLRLLGEVGGTVLFIVSLMHLEFADANGIQQFGPLAITAGSALFLGERVGWRRWLATFAGLVGVLLIIKPGTGAFNWYALLSAACVLFVAVRDLATRRLPASIPTLMLALSSAAAVALAGLGLGAFETWHWPTQAQLGQLVGAAFFLVCGYFLITYSIRSAEIATVIPFRYSVTIYAVLAQLVVWGTLPDSLGLLGLVIVVLAGLYTFHRERVRQREAADA